MTAELDASTLVKTIESKKILIQGDIICRTCKNGMSRIKRGGFVKTFLFWLPLKRFTCYKCRTKTYKWVR